MPEQRTINIEQAAKELCALIKTCDSETIATLYEEAFGAVEYCWVPENDLDTLIIEYVEGCEPKE